MKRYAITLLAAAGLIAGCQQSIQTASQKFNELPPAVQKTARAQAPNAEIVDVSSTTQDGVEAYEIKFQQNGQTPKVVVAVDGKLLSTDFTTSPGAVERLLTPTGATGTQFSSLPVAVQKTIQSHAPKRQISNISRHEDNGRVIYEIEFRDEAKNNSMKVSEDGTVVQDIQQ